MNIQKYGIKLILCSIFIAGMIFNAESQTGYNKERIKEKVKTQRVAFITEKLDLNETEAQKFWPIYNSYQTELEQLRATLDLNPHRDMTDKEAEDMMYSMLDGRGKEIEIQKKYIQKMKTAIPARKIAMLFKVEREFKEKLISKIRERRRDKENE